MSKWLKPSVTGLRQGTMMPVAWDVSKDGKDVSDGTFSAFELAQGRNMLPIVQANSGNCHRNRGLA